VLDQVPGFFHEIVVPLFAFIKPVPPGVVRGHHGRAHAGPAAFVVPQFVVFHFQPFIEELGLVQQALFIQLVQHFFGRFEVDLVVFFHHLVQFVMVVHPGLAVALGADFFHLVPFDLASWSWPEKGLEVGGPDGQRGLKFPG
jgi:hypothetical protein